MEDLRTGSNEEKDTGIVTLHIDAETAKVILSKLLDSLEEDRKTHGGIVAPQLDVQTAKTLFAALLIALDANESNPPAE